MFKKAFTLAIFFILLTSLVFSVRLIDPLSKELSGSDSFVGTVAVGNTMEMIFSKELTNKYQSLEVLSSSIKDLKYSINYEKESIKLFVTVPKTADVERESMQLKFFGSSVSDIVDLELEVVSGVLGVSPVSTAEVNTFVDSKADYKLFFVNNTDSEAVFVISNDLPANWASPSMFELNKSTKKVVVPKRSSLEESFSVYPRLEGSKEFKATVSFENTSKNFSFKVNASPTLKSKLSTVIYGLPFYSFSLLPSYFVNGLFSFALGN
jgi:hypothetical protein